MGFPVGWVFRVVPLVLVEVGVFPGTGEMGEGSRRGILWLSRKGIWVTGSDWSRLLGIGQQVVIGGEGVRV